MIDRRTFLAGSVAAAVAAARQPRHLETLLEWMNASRKARADSLQPCVEFIRKADVSIQAWVEVKPQKPTGDGPLADIPFGVKEIIETVGLATEYGSPIYKGRIGTADAAIVRVLRQRGGVLLGKTRSTAFAYRTPTSTRNPRDLAHTPGGSSSGSAAAVAAGMVPLAIGTQTGGSVLRPASFCGVTGFKTSYGLLSMDGVFPFAKSLDTLGFFTQTAADMLAFWESMGHDTSGMDDFTIATPDPSVTVDDAMASAFERTLSRLRKSGMAIQPIDIAPMLEKLVDAQRVVMFYEGARFHEERFKQFGDRLADMANLVREGLQIPAHQYEDALQYIDDCRKIVTQIYKATPVILVPAAVGTAPLGLATTGDSRMNAPWTALGVPAISIPMPIGSGLPLGLQLTADHGYDARLIRAAVKVEKLLRES